MPKRSTRSFKILPCVLSLAMFASDAAFAQDPGSSGVTTDRTPPAPQTEPKPKRNKYGSPLDTLMTTHLWADVPPARDFVTQTRPDVKTLDYTPLTGTDPDRPKPRDAANIAALRAELEGDAVKNEHKARALRPALKPHGKPSIAPRP